MALLGFSENLTYLRNITTLAGNLPFAILYCQDWYIIWVLQIWNDFPHKAMLSSSSWKLTHIKTIQTLVQILQTPVLGSLDTFWQYSLYKYKLFFPVLIYLSFEYTSSEDCLNFVYIIHNKDVKYTTFIIHYLARFSIQKEYVVYQEKEIVCLRKDSVDLVWAF